MKPALVFILACLLRTGTAFTDTPDRAAIAKLWDTNAEAEAATAKIAAINAKYPGLIDDAKLHELVLLGTWLKKNGYYDATGRLKGDVFTNGTLDQDFESRLSRDDSARARLDLFKKKKHSANIASALLYPSFALTALAGFAYLFDRAGNDPPKTNFGYYFAAGSVATFTVSVFSIGYNVAAKRDLHEAIRRYNVSVVLGTF